MDAPSSRGKQGYTATERLGLAFLAVWILAGAGNLVILDATFVHLGELMTAITIATYLMTGAVLLWLAWLDLRAHAGAPEAAPELAAQPAPEAAPASAPKSAPAKPQPKSQPTSTRGAVTYASSVPAFDRLSL